MMSKSPETTASSAGQESSAGSAPLRSYEDTMDSLRGVLHSLPPDGEPIPDNQIHCNPKIRGMRWTLNGPLETAVMVVRD